MINKPKSFYIGLPRPNSKKFEVTKELNDQYGYEVTIDEKYSAILFNGQPTIYVTKDFGTDWTYAWNWNDIASRAGKKLSEMIKYLKSLQ